jgi:hypothetical protein
MYATPATVPLAQHVLSAYMCPDQSRGSSVGIATGYGVPVVVVGGGCKNFAFSMSSRAVMGPTSPPIQWVPRGFSPGLKRPGREADHSN